MGILPNLCFVALLVAGIGFFITNIRKLIRNIRLGKAIDRNDNPSARWANMALIAMGQSKMTRRPVAGILHIVVYAGFIIINIELLEIMIDGLLGTHRIFSFIKLPYNILIGAFECLALGVIVAVTIFWIRRNIFKLWRFSHRDLKGNPKKDANIILYFETVLMLLFLFMNAADQYLQSLGSPHYVHAGYFPVSQHLVILFNGLSESMAITIERTVWWLHIIGILFFMNYLYYSKHLHILLAFPNTYFADLNPKGKFDNLASVTAEVKLLTDPNADPFASQPDIKESETIKFGASDVQDLSWVQLLNAYTCTECGRCTSACPANLTGKKLSPRKIMMDTRDRLEEVGKNIDNNNGIFLPDGKALLHSYITPEELWACTTCNACVEQCPVNISPLSIIVDMRRFLVMEESAAPMPLNAMMSNIENNAAPWQYNQQDRLNWRDEL